MTEANMTEEHKSTLLLISLQSLGFSKMEIEFNRKLRNIGTRIDKLFDPGCEDLYFGSKSEGLEGGFFYAGERSDIDCVLPFPEVMIFPENSDLKKIKLLYQSVEEKKCHYSFPYIAVIDSDYPGYRKLRGVSEFESAHYEMINGYLPNTFSEELVHKTNAKDLNVTFPTSVRYEKSGPAVTEILFNNNTGGEMTNDCVPCFLYNYIPEEARSWKYRCKPHGWPQKQLIETILSKNCLLAPVGHIDSKSEDFQWRLSFKGESLLVKSLNQVQIACYVLLKMILKDDLTENAFENGRKAISSYCIKQTVFWCVELERIEWKIENFIACVHACIRKLQCFIRNRRLPHYIIEGRNLLNSRLTEKSSVLLIHRLDKYLDDIWSVLRLRSFGFPLTLSKTMVMFSSAGPEVSIITACLNKKIKYLYYYHGVFNFFWRQYDRRDVLKSINNHFKMLKYILKCRYFVFEDIYIDMIESSISLLCYSYYKVTQPVNSYYLHNAIYFLLRSRLRPTKSRVLLRSASLLFMNKCYTEVLEICEFFVRKPLTVTPAQDIWNEIFTIQSKWHTKFLGFISTYFELLPVLRKAVLSSAYGVYTLRTYPKCVKDFIWQFENRMIEDSHFNVTFMTTELLAVPEVLQFELLSLPLKLKTLMDDGSSLPLHDDIAGIRVHPALLCNLLIFLCYNSMGENDKLAECLSLIESLPIRMPQYTLSMIHFNILAYCFAMNKDNRKAAQYVVKSLQMFPCKENAAHGYFKYHLPVSCINVTLD